MEEQNCENSVQFSPLAMNYMVKNAYGISGDHYANLDPVIIPEWMHSQQMPEKYVEFLAGSGCPKNQRQMPCNISTQGPSFGLAYPSHLEEHPGPHNVGNFDKRITGLESLYGVQEQNWSEIPSQAFQACSGPGAAALEIVSETRRKRSRERAYAADRFRRLKISHGLDALKELVAQPEEVGKAALLDNVIDHVKYLQNQVKDLSQSRLGGEPTSNSLIFLEGHGHYVFQGQMLNGPVEHMLGKLIDLHPSAVTDLLQSRGLIAMPMTFAEDLLEPIEAFNVQEKETFSVPSDRVSKFGLP